MLPKEVIQQIRRIQITTNRTVNEVFAGEYESTFKGQGMQFDEVREYTPGDDIRSIDWNVTARTGRPHIKRYVEERELTVMLIVDLSASGAFGTVGGLKNELAAELCAVLAFSAIRNNDKVGLITFTDRIELFIPPDKGNRHILRVIRELLYSRPPHRGTDIPMALDYVARVLRKKATVFLVSDFLGLGPQCQRKLSLVNRRHDVIAVQVRDPREQQLPPAGLMLLQDAETGESMWVDSSSRAVRRSYEANARARDAGLQELFRKAGVDSISVGTDRSYVRELIRFFRMREKRR